MRALLFSLFTIFVLQNAHAFTLVSDIDSGWAKPELTFLVNESSCTSRGISASALNAAIDEAVNLWNAVPTSSLRIKRGATTSLTVHNDPPVIMCATTLTGSPDQDFVLAQGSFTYNATKRPLQGLIEINGDSSKKGYFNNLNATQAAIAIAHEMGHVLGLGHSETKDALMYYDISAKESLNLSQDDVDGITWLNPRNEPSNGFMGCGTLSAVSGGGSGPGNMSILFTWLGIILIAYLGSRSRKSIRNAIAYATHGFHYFRVRA